MFTYTYTQVNMYINIYITWEEKYRFPLSLWPWLFGDFGSDFRFANGFVVDGFFQWSRIQSLQGWRFRLGIPGRLPEMFHVILVVTGWGVYRSIQAYCGFFCASIIDLKLSFGPNMPRNCVFDAFFFALKLLQTNRCFKLQQKKHFVSKHIHPQGRDLQKFMDPTGSLRIDAEILQRWKKHNRRKLVPKPAMFIVRLVPLGLPKWRRQKHIPEIWSSQYDQISQRFHNDWFDMSSPLMEKYAKFSWCVIFFC